MLFRTKDTQTILVLHSYNRIPDYKRTDIWFHCPYIYQAENGTEKERERFARRIQRIKTQDVSVTRIITIKAKGVPLDNCIPFSYRFKIYAKMFIGMGFFLVFEVISGMIDEDLVPEAVW